MRKFIVKSLEKLDLNDNDLKFCTQVHKRFKIITIVTKQKKI